MDVLYFCVYFRYELFNVSFIWLECAGAASIVIFSTAAATATVT